jgi:hypothetical protein
VDGVVEAKCSTPARENKGGYVGYKGIAAAHCFGRGN